MAIWLPKNTSADLWVSGDSNGFINHIDYVNSETNEHLRVDIDYELYADVIDSDTGEPFMEIEPYFEYATELYREAREQMENPKRIYWLLRGCLTVYRVATDGTAEEIYSEILELKSLDLNYHGSAQSRKALDTAINLILRDDRDLFIRSIIDSGDGGDLDKWSAL